MLKIKCVRCKKQTRNFGRGLCHACYVYEHRHGNLERYSVSTNRGGGLTISICTSCKEKKQIVSYGLCGSCYGVDYMRNLDNKKRHAESEARRRAKDPEAFRKYERERSRTPRRKNWRKKYNSEYYKKNKLKLTKALKEWKDKNRKYIRDYWRVHQAQRRAAEGETTLLQWQAIVAHYCPGELCLSCGEPFNIDSTRKQLTIDHVLPLNLGGTNWPYNLQPLCMSCNAKKRVDSFDFRPDQGAYARSLMNES